MSVEVTQAVTIAELMEALDFYANPDNYQEAHFGEVPHEVTLDGGEIARKALGETQ
jgi:hypothetical protein